MIRNYLVVTLRQLWKFKLFSFLNIFGLATSMAVCLLLIMILADQYSYDTFHTKKDRIFRVISGSGPKDHPIKKASRATSPLSLAEQLNEDYPFIESTTRIVEIHKEYQANDRRLSDQRHGCIVDQNFLDIFSFGWVAGDQRTALIHPRSMVLTETTAKKWFPNAEPIGAKIESKDLGIFTITGIIPDPPVHSHIQFNYLMSFSSVTNAFTDLEKKSIYLEDFSSAWRGYVYFLIDEQLKTNELHNAMAELSAIHSDENSEIDLLYTTQAFTNVRPSKDLSNELNMGTAIPSMVLRFLMALGIIVTLAACFNYMNLSIARSLKRAKEIGVRKVAGARKIDIVIQFLGEAVLIALLSLGVALVLLEFLLPAFYGLDPFVETTVNLRKTPLLYLAFLGFSIVVGLLAGLFPAFNISNFQPIESIKQLTNVKLFGRLGIRKVLVTIQFMLSLIFILSVIVLLNQQRTVVNSDLGVRIENMYYVNLEKASFETFAQEVRQLRGVQEVSGSNYALLSGQRGTKMMQFNQGKDSVEIHSIIGTNNFIQNQDIQLIAGENFPENINSRGEQFILLNEMAVKRMGFETPEEALGTSIQMDSMGLVISGVLADFHHEDIWWEPIRPFGIRHQPNENYAYANIRLSGKDISATTASIKEIWESFNPGSSMNASFVDDHVYHMSKFFNMGSKIVGFVGFLTVLISCLGLLGMVIYTVEGKVKEVGIRKVLGASETNIIWQLSKGFLLLLGIAVLITVPLAVFGTKLWLQNFVIRMKVVPSIFILGVGIILILGLITIISQTYLAAKSNPANTLRAE